VEDATPHFSRVNYNLVPGINQNKLTYL